MSMREKHILARAVVIQKTGGDQAFFRDKRAILFWKENSIFVM